MKLTNRHVSHVYILEPCHVSGHCTHVELNRRHSQPQLTILVTPAAVDPGLADDHRVLLATADTGHPHSRHTPELMDCTRWSSGRHLSALTQPGLTRSTPSDQVSSVRSEQCMIVSTRQRLISDQVIIIITSQSSLTDLHRVSLSDTDNIPPSSAPD